MCAPVAIAALTLLSAGYSAYSTQQAGKANAQIAENNAQLARDQAQVENAIGDRESQQAQWRTRALLGQQRAAIAANNIDASVGTPAEILGETAMFGEADQQNIRLNAARRAWGFNAQAGDYLNQSKQIKYNAKTQATGTILSGLASAAGGYANAGGGA